MSQIFSPKIVTKTPSRNRFPLSDYNRVTTRMGDLTPVLCKKVLPGDRWRVGLSSITRLTPLANPVYDRVRITFDAFFVQNRILDPDWKNYVSPDPEAASNPSTGMTMSGSFVKVPSPQDESYTFGPVFRRNFRRGGIFDYLGMQFSKYTPLGLPYYGDLENIDFKFSAYPYLGYLKIWDNWYRNERFQTSQYNELMKQYTTVSRNVDFSQFGAITVDPAYNSEYGFLRVNYGKDLYTTALESPMIGGPVNIPSGQDLIPVSFEANNNKLYAVTARTDSSSNISLETGVTGASGTLVADMKNAVLGTIQELKFAYALFSFYMKDTYNGNRYVEFMQAHYGVTVPDSTLERSLFLGRITQYINFSEIFQTSGATSEQNTLGDYAGVGAATGSGFLFDYNFLEHGYLYILMSIRPNATYFQGVDRKFFYGDRFDELYMPEFQNIGDKPIFNNELYADLTIFDNGAGGGDIDMSWTNINNSPIFGYNRANAEYIWFHDEMHGNFLNENGEFNWTFARQFDTPPLIGDAFSSVTAINNPFTYQGVDSLNYVTDIMFDIKALRPVVRYEHY